MPGGKGRSVAGGDLCISDTPAALAPSYTCHTPCHAAALLLDNKTQQIAVAVIRKGSKAARSRSSASESDLPFAELSSPGWKQRAKAIFR